MLQRVGPNTFQARTGDTVRIIAIAANNGGIEGASFRYGGPPPLPPATILNHPGCSFPVKTPVTMFGCVVVFAPGAAGARYDLFEVDANGTPIDLQESVNPAFGPLVQFQVRGVPVPVPVGVGPGGPVGAAPLGAAPPPPLPPARAKAAKAAKPAKAKKKTAKKKTAKKRASAKKPATRKPARRKPAKKKTGGRTSRKRTRGGR